MAAPGWGGSAADASAASAIESNSIESMHAERLVVFASILQSVGSKARIFKVERGALTGPSSAIAHHLDKTPVRLLPRSHDRVTSADSK